MKFISIIRVDEKSARPPSEKLAADMNEMLEELTRSGVMIDARGLRPTSEATRVRLSKGKLSTIDGPFSEAKEVIGGYSIVEVKSKEEAVELARRFLAIHGDGWEIECEVRQLEEDCGDGQ